ncbi:MAG: hypothetical protein IPN85_14575 [Flavobacteriales bacterium]|nr:hypothetical protein [Flavobacteriales bacterium]MBK9288090.1 hypothetical protein [Flavobacteriales bacterium]
MKISITPTFDTELSSGASIVHELAKELGLFFEDKEYGDSVQKIGIGLLMVFHRPGFEHLFKPRRPYYVDKEIESPLTGEKIKVEKYLGIEIRLKDNALDSIMKGTPVEVQLVVLSVIYDYLMTLDKLPLKARDFKKKQFLADLDRFKKQLETALS